VRKVIYAFMAITILAVIAGFPAYMAFGQGGGLGGNQVSVTVSATPVVTPGGGGGGGGGGGDTGCPAGQVSCINSTTTQCLVILPIEVTSFDERFQLTIDRGTTALTLNKACVTCIGILAMEGSPSPPKDAYVVSIMYDAIPDSANFSPPAIIKYSYDPASIPEGVAENRLVIAYYDKANGEWVVLDGVVDTEAKTITAQISQFNDLAVFGYEPEAPPPANFEISLFGISPDRVYSGETVTISMLVTNTGGQSGSYQVIFKVNGEVEATQEVILDTGASEQVSFTTLKGTVGTYSVDVNGATDTFNVELMPLPSEPFPWWLIAAIIAALTLAALLTYVFIAQKKPGGVSGALTVEITRIATLAPKLGPKLKAVFSSLLSKFKKG
jgi:hypothetical protein